MLDDCGAAVLELAMSVEDHWLANLQAIVQTEGGGRIGYRSVSLATGLSEEYIYQLCERKPKPDGTARQVGKLAAKKIATAYANGRPLTSARRTACVWWRCSTG